MEEPLSRQSEYSKLEISSAHTCSSLAPSLKSKGIRGTNIYDIQFMQHSTEIHAVGFQEERKLS